MTLSTILKTLSHIQEIQNIKRYRILQIPDTAPEIERNTLLNLSIVGTTSLNSASQTTENTGVFRVQPSQTRCGTWISWMHTLKLSKILDEHIGCYSIFFNRETHTMLTTRGFSGYFQWIGKHCSAEYSPSSPQYLLTSN